MKNINKKDIPSYLIILKEMKQVYDSMSEAAEKGKMYWVDSEWSEGCGILRGAAMFSIYSETYVDWFFRRARKTLGKKYSAARSLAMVNYYKE